MSRLYVWSQSQLPQQVFSCSLCLLFDCFLFDRDCIPRHSSKNHPMKIYWTYCCTFWHRDISITAILIIVIILIIITIIECNQIMIELIVEGILFY